MKNVMFIMFWTFTPTNLTKVHKVCMVYGMAEYRKQLLILCNTIQSKNLLS